MSAELDAFMLLQLRGTISPETQYSPTKSKNGYYTGLLKEVMKEPLAVDGQGNPIPDEARTLAQGLVKLEARATELLNQRVAQAHRVIHLREAASDLGLNIRDGELRRVLADARRTIAGSAEAIGARPISLAPVPWMVDGLLMARGLNLYIAPPKCGKTSLVMQMISQWAAGAPSYLGRQFRTPCPPVLVVGPDMPEGDWGLLLRDLDLLQEDLRLKAPIVDLFTAGQPLTLDEEGIERIGQYAASHPGLLVVLDSVHTATVRLGISENDPEIAGPLLSLIEALEPHGATLLAIHHANKARMGETPTLASRGSSAIPALASHMVGMSRLTQQPQMNGKSDRRVVLKTEGRGGMPLELLVERVEDAGWICHGDADAVQSEKQRHELESKLNERQIEALEACRERWELDGLPMDAMDLAPMLGLRGDGERKARATLDQLTRLGFLNVEVQNTGVSRRKVFSPVGIPRGLVSLRASEASEASEPEAESLIENLQNTDGERDRRVQRDKRVSETRGGVRRATLRTAEQPTNGVLRFPAVGSGADAMEDGDDPHWPPRQQAATGGP